MKEVDGGPKLVHVTFNITEGPKVKIGEIDFIGNKALSDGKLGKKMKENKAKGFFGFIIGGGTFKEEKFAEDADKVEALLPRRGYIEARVGQPETEGPRGLEGQEDPIGRVADPDHGREGVPIGKIDFEGNKIVNARRFGRCSAQDGRHLQREADSQGVREDQGSVRHRRVHRVQWVSGPAPRAAHAARPTETRVPTSPRPAHRTRGQDGKPIVDVMIRLQEGKQYFVNRITFVGNTTTRDNVIRREVRLVERGVFNTEALKKSIKRLNQLGYFKPLEGEAIGVDKTPNVDNKVDIRLKFEEQNRNQLTFGAGVSQYDGFFGQLSFQTSNFLGRGETFTGPPSRGAAPRTTRWRSASRSSSTSR